MDTDVEYQPMIRDIPAGERPRERLERYGASALSTAELLAIVLRGGDFIDTEASGNWFDEVIVATGVAPRDPEISGQDAPHVLSYVDVLRGGAPVGPRVAIVHQAPDLLGELQGRPCRQRDRAPDRQCLPIESRAVAAAQIFQPERFAIIG